ncbi:hypothetical protein I6F35_12630 [Bradyrhizobium sp. BRP22]|uniref:hypothetical protein n=1 Tax=Bradyrhizobium sp. BRP22 TaxID=2793821 RepID=UPI001CD7D1D2|nr:hypothetical protein [Bradyrhizobium sp. BRP22]MCA1454058.1 hypothetical protein [Bradyrhizobium sp. BRP22]
MTIRKRPPKRSKLAHARDLAPGRALMLDDVGCDELLDDWMVAYPATEPVPAGA